MFHSGLPSTTPRLRGPILRRTMASIASPCSPTSPRISRPWRNATAKFGISTSPSSRIRASASRARKRMRASLSFMFFDVSVPAGPSNLAAPLQREAFSFGEALANLPAQKGDIEPRVGSRMLFRHTIGLVVDLRLGLEIRRHQFDHAGNEVLLAYLGL